MMLLTAERARTVWAERRWPRVSGEAGGAALHEPQTADAAAGPAGAGDRLQGAAAEVHPRSGAEQR